MSSALNAWRGQSNAVFEEIERIHREVGGQKPGRRYLTRQINYAYVALLAAHFQGYCRAVHSEAIQILVAEVSDPALGAVLEGRLNDGRQLDKGNANIPNLGSDFGRFGFRFWNAIRQHRARNEGRQEKLNDMNKWRNAIAHGDIAAKQQAGDLVPKEVHLATCHDWKRALNQLVHSIDAVLADQCENLGCPRPW